MLFALISNTVIITIHTIKTMTMPIISHFISAIILLHMFVNKGKVNTSRHFSYAASLEKSQHNMATLPPIFLDKPVFSSKKFYTPPPPLISINFEKIKPPHCEAWGSGGKGGEVKLQKLARPDIYHTGQQHLHYWHLSFIDK